MVNDARVKRFRRQVAIWMAWVLVVGIISACSESTPQQQAKSQPDALQPADQVQKPVLEPKSYILVDKQTKKNKIDIQFPQLSEWKISDPDKQRRINRLIERRMMSYLEMFSPEELKITSGEFGASVQFAGKRMLSLSINIDFYMENGSRPARHVDNMTIDLEQERILRLSDLVNIDQSLVDVIRTLQPSNSGGVEDEGLENVLNRSDEELIRDIKQMEWDDFQFDPPNLNLTFEVPYAIGSTAWIPLAFSKLKPNLAVSEQHWATLLEPNPDADRTDGQLLHEEEADVLALVRNRVPEIEVYEKQLADYADNVALLTYLESYPRLDRQTPFYTVVLAETSEQRITTVQRFRVDRQIRTVTAYEPISGLYLDLRDWRAKQGGNVRLQRTDAPQTFRFVNRDAVQRLKVDKSYVSAAKGTITGDAELGAWMELMDGSTPVTDDRYEWFDGYSEFTFFFKNGGQRTYPFKMRRAEVNDSYVELFWFEDPVTGHEYRLLLPDQEKFSAKLLALESGY